LLGAANGRKLFLKIHVKIQVVISYVFADFTMLTFVFVSHKIGCLARRRLLRPREGHLPILHPTSYTYVTESCRRDAVQNTQCELLLLLLLLHGVR